MGPYAQLAPEQLQHAPERPLPPLAQAEVEQEPQRQHELDGQVGLDGLAAKHTALQCLARKCCLVQPKREVPAPPHPCLTRRPVRDLVAGAENTMTAAALCLKAMQEP